MPKVSVSEDFDLRTRNDYTKVACRISTSVEGKELPSMSVLAEALEQAIALFQAKVSDSYKIVPERIETPIAQPYVATPKPDDEKLERVEL